MTYPLKAYLKATVCPALRCWIAPDRHMIFAPEGHDRAIVGKQDELLEHGGIRTRDLLVRGEISDKQLIEAGWVRVTVGKDLRDIHVECYVLNPVSEETIRMWAYYACATFNHPVLGINNKTTVWTSWDKRMLETSIVSICGGSLLNGSWTRW